jgi:hypothetical protein
LRIGALVDKAAIELACARLRDSGILQSISYRYAPGPKRGFALTLIIAGHDSLADATLDFPGIDEPALWQWLVSQYPSFNHKVPGNEAAQQFIAKSWRRTSARGSKASTWSRGWKTNYSRAGE